jgi:hypothetical protein
MFRIEFGNLMSVKIKQLLRAKWPTMGGKNVPLLKKVGAQQTTSVQVERRIGIELVV